MRSGSSNSRPACPTPCVLLATYYNVTMPPGSSSLQEARGADELVRAIEVLTSVGSELSRALPTAVHHLLQSLEAFTARLPRTDAIASSFDEAEIRRLAVIRGSDALFTGWVARFGFAEGTLAATVAAFREMTSIIPALPPPVGLSEMASSIDPARYRALVSAELSRMQEPLDRIGSALQLSDRGLGAIFGVSRQAVAQWRERGIPSARAESVADVVETVDLLARKLKPGRLPLVASRPATAFGGLSLLESLANNPAETRELVESRFDWAATA